mmetsp:Transcript_26278/g.64917  ORF Transcript_26278/g.64917 Transcript_26278/m.64917 type:complete len:1013 (+) Transcript_26278:112-3150(+)
MPLPRTQVDPRDLKPGALVEVLDVAKHWFPAQVLSATSKGVRVHFVDWPGIYDADLPIELYATNICQFRGWGKTIAGDFRIGDPVEALDLVGKTCMCRVVAVAESSVKVHYQGWTKKWDEWIQRSTGRLQRLKAVPAGGIFGPARPPSKANAKMAKTKSGGAERDLASNDEICSVCFEGGTLDCCEGPCLRSFHAGCLESLLADAGAPPQSLQPSGPHTSERAAKEAGPASGSVELRARAQAGSASLLASNDAKGSGQPPSEVGGAEGDGSGQVRRETRGSGKQPMQARASTGGGSCATPGEVRAGAEPMGSGDGSGSRLAYRSSGAPKASAEEMEDEETTEELEEEEVLAAPTQPAAECAAECVAEEEGEEEEEECPWVCCDCTRRVHCCVLCGEVEAEAETLPSVKCMRGNCGRFFHPGCLTAAYSLYGPACTAADSARLRGECHSHVCMECGEAETGRYGEAMAVCDGCGCGFHLSCIPSGSSSFKSYTLRHGKCEECTSAQNKKKGRSGQCAYGFPPFRFAPKREGDFEDGSNEKERVPRAPRTKAEVLNLQLRDNMRISSEVGFPWEPLLFPKKKPQHFTLPSDIEGDLRSGTCDAASGFKPPAYSNLQRSIWLGGAGSREEVREREDVGPCVCSAVGVRVRRDERFCEEGCQNRHMRHECSSDNCLVEQGERCTNRSIQRGQVPQLSVFKTFMRGWGLRADEAIPSGQYCVEYVGEVIDREEWERRNALEGEHEAMYYMNFSQMLIIDARRKGNASRFINHSCDPNVVVQKWYVNSEPRLAMFALRDICAREELTYDYNVLWTGRAGQRCYCGASNCTGQLSAVSARAARKGKGKPKRKRRRSSMDTKTRAQQEQPCKTCGAADDVDSTLLCDKCDTPYHMHCLLPRLDAVPDGDWFCPECQPESSPLESPLGGAPEPAAVEVPAVALPPKRTATLDGAPKPAAALGGAPKPAATLPPLGGAPTPASSLPPLGGALNPVATRPAQLASPMLPRQAFRSVPTQRGPR